jgi:hypothetical protein
MKMSRVKQPTGVAAAFPGARVITINHPSWVIR